MICGYFEYHQRWTRDSFFDRKFPFDVTMPKTCQSNNIRLQFVIWQAAFSSANDTQIQQCENRLNRQLYLINELFGAVIASSLTEFEQLERNSDITIIKHCSVTTSKWLRHPVSSPGGGAGEGERWGCWGLAPVTVTTPPVDIICNCIWYYYWCHIGAGRECDVNDGCWVDSVMWGNCRCKWNLMDVCWQN